MYANLTVLYIKFYSLLFHSVMWSIHFVCVHLIPASNSYSVCHGVYPKHCISLLSCAGHLDWLQCLSTTNDAAGNIPASILLWIRVRLSLAYNARAELLSHVHVQLLFWVPCCCPEWLHIPHHCVRVFIALNLHHHLVLPGFLICCQPDEYRITCLNLHFPDC